MFRLGSLLFIPAYLTVTLYRHFASDGNGNSFFVMAGTRALFRYHQYTDIRSPEALTLSTAIRTCGATLTYTAVAILLNYMSPPPIVGLANGLAQSIVSLARFMGPIMGGYVRFCLGFYELSLTLSS